MLEMVTISDNVEFTSPLLSRQSTAIKANIKSQLILIICRRCRKEVSTTIMQFTDSVLTNRNGFSNERKFVVVFLSGVKKSDFVTPNSYLVF